MFESEKNFTSFNVSQTVIKTTRHDSNIKMGTFCTNQTRSYLDERQHYTIKLFLTNKLLDQKDGFFFVSTPALDKSEKVGCQNSLYKLLKSNHRLQ